MTQHLDVARSRDVLARWCALAEQRLEYLTELFETGRWRRFHSELDFLKNIQEAKAAVETWRDLSTRGASRDNTAIDMSWLGRPRTALPRIESWRTQVQPQPPLPAALSTEPPLPDVSITLADDHLSSDEAPSSRATDNASELTLGIAAAVAERYPLLRNTL